MWNETVLKGLDGSNLLAFLAALGTFRLLARAEAEGTVQMSWRDEGWWTPVILHERRFTSEDLVNALAAASLNEACGMAADLTLKTGEFAQVLERALERNDREELDYLAAFGSEFIGSGPKRDQMSDTGFRTMSGAGHQHFLGFMRELAESTDAAHIKKALFSIWDYSDERPSLRWDPADYRPHALRADDPSKAPIRTMRGANRLAFEALPLFPTYPYRRSLMTVAFDVSEDAVIRWPNWTDPLDLASARSLLGLDWERFAGDQGGGQFGVAQLFESTRFTEGKFRNFTFSRAMRA